MDSGEQFGDQQRYNKIKEQIIESAPCLKAFIYKNPLVVDHDMPDLILVFDSWTTPTPMDWHTSHWKGFMPVCEFWCSSSSILDPNRDWHIVHGYGLFRSCDLAIADEEEEEEEVTEEEDGGMEVANALEEEEEVEDEVVGTEEDEEVGGGRRGAEGAQK